MINQFDKDFIIKCLEDGVDIPYEYKYLLFPTTQKETELVYAGKMRKEDILSDTDEVSNVPLQVEKTFNLDRSQTDSDEWRNLLIFGDNLQILKTIYYNNDPLIANKIKGKVKLIYIDPPFATDQEFKTSKGQKAYVDKVKGSKFIEFLRRRLFVLREMLSEDGSIYVHLDYRNVHYIKIIMDEIFGENCFINEITWKRTSAHNDSGKYGINTEYILFYSKSEDYTWNGQFTEYTEKHLERFRRADEDGRVWTDGPLTAKGLSGGGYTYSYKGVTDVWRCPLATMERLDRENRLHFTNKGGLRVKKYLDELNGTPLQALWNDIDPINSQSKERVSYPTQKPEELLKRIILASTNENDIVMDCFAGSGTTIAVAEKLNRRWIGCDLGKLSMYTIQKRLLEISNSKCIINNKNGHGIDAKPFSVLSAGLYDLGKVFSLSEEKYKPFVKKLFDIEDVVKKQINGVSIDGLKRGFYVKIYPYWNEEMRNADVDISYLEELHRNIGDRIKSRFYIVAPANSVAFVNDYYEIDGVRYFFLKIPYQVIRELHNQNFKKIKQPQSKVQVNALDEAVGFHFIRQPQVESKLEKKGKNFSVVIEKFMSDYNFDESGKELTNFESLSMVLIDDDYNGNFIMKEYYFAKDLIDQTKKRKEVEDTSDEIRSILKSTANIQIPIKTAKNKKLMIVYIDIYGNEFKEVFDLEVK